MDLTAALTASRILQGAFTLAVQGAGLFTIGFALTAAAATGGLLRRRRGAGGALPPVSLLKPLKGRDRGLYENLASFCAQEYPDFQIIFCVADADDPALETIARLRTNFPKVDMETVVSARRIGCNPKISNLANGYPKAKHGLLLISDSDVRVDRDFLRRATSAMADPRVGMATFFYRTLDARGIWGKLEALAINAYFLPQAAVAATFGMRFAMGAAMVVRREAFEAMGGLPALADHIADDYSLGAGIQAAGWRLEYAEGAVALLPENCGPADLIRHQIRESRVIRICQPAGYLGTIVLQGPALLALHMAFFGASGASLALLSGGLAARALAAHALSLRAGGGGLPLAHLALLPAAEALSLLYWVTGFSASQVLWRGEAYSIAANGRLIPVAEN